jgi:hypothetical protein
MMPERDTRIANLVRVATLAMAIALLAGCADDTTGPGDGNAPPTLASVADQAVVRNTLAPRSLELELQIQDPDDDSLTVSVSSDVEAVLPAFQTTCAPGSCPLTLTPKPGETVAVTVTATVDDGGGGQAATSFELRVEPALVTNADDDGPGSLRRTIADALPGDVVGFDENWLFASTRTIALLGQIDIEKSLTIEGPTGSNLAVNGAKTVRVFAVRGGADVTIRDLIVSEGSAPVEDVERPGGGLEAVSAGGGIFVGPGSDVRLVDVAIVANLADEGGGIWVSHDARLTLERSVVSTNVAQTTGGGVRFAGTEMTLLESDISDNGAALGGGLAIGPIGGRTVVLDATTLRGNAATQVGGAIAHALESPSVRSELLLRNGTRIVDSEATNAGAIYQYSTDGDLETILEESFVEDNRALDSGGGIMSFRAFLTVRDAGGSFSSLLQRNVAGGDGGGLYAVESFVRFEDGATIIANRADGDGGGVYLDTSTLVVSGGSCRILANVADADADADGSGGGIYNDGGDIGNVPPARVCLNDPDDIVG